MAIKEITTAMVEKKAQEFWAKYQKADEWERKHTNLSNYKTFNKCLESARHALEWQLKLEQAKKEKKSSKAPKGHFKFEKEKMRSCYWTYKKYLQKRCESLPRQLERKFKCEADYTASRCAGMSNYIFLFTTNPEGWTDKNITIRISDHEPTGSGSSCDYYIYVQGKTWAEIKEQVFKIAEDFLN